MNIIVSIEEGLGNAIQAMPLIMALSKVAEIDVVCSNRSYEFFLHQPVISELFYYETFKPDKRYKIGLIPQYTSGASIRILKPHCEQLVYNLHPDWSKESESQCNLDLAQALGIYAKVEDFPVTFKGAKKPIDNQYINWQGKQLVAFHFGCFNAPQWNNRKWSVKNWIYLVDMIGKERYTPVIIHKDGDSEDAKTILMNVNSICIDFANRTLQSVAGALKQCEMLISLDSGIMHLASTQGIKQISLWGCTHEGKSRPLNIHTGRHKIIRDESIPCKRCYINDRALWLSCRDNKCMQAIKPEMVFNIFKEMNNNG